MKSLNTPVKRFGFIILIIGIAISIIAVIQIASSYYDSSRIFSSWVKSVFFEKYTYRKYPLAAYGAWLAIFGLLLSYGYERSVGKLIKWVQTGESVKAAEPKKSVALHFKDPKSALDHSCRYMDTNLAPDQITPCLVISTSHSEQSGAFAVIDIPSENGPKRAVAAFTSNVRPSDIVGRFCAAHVGPLDPRTGEMALLICGELSLTWQDGVWGVKRRF